MKTTIEEIRLKRKTHKELVAIAEEKGLPTSVMVSESSMRASGRDAPCTGFRPASKSLLVERIIKNQKW